MAIERSGALSFDCATRTELVDEPPRSVAC